MKGRKEREKRKKEAKFCGTSAATQHSHAEAAG
jgi:hypothetical protein